MVTHQEISEMIQRIKQEPREDGPDIKQCNDSLSKTSRSKRKSAEDIGSTPGQKRLRHLSENGKPTIPCLMCDRYLENKDELMIHMALDHQCPPQGSRRQVGRIPKHTCQICFAKFRTLRDLFTHTALHAKQMEINGEWVSAFGSRMESLTKQGTIRQYFTNIENNLHGEIQHGTFKCDCCNNVFLNRDTYAMHVMMRVKDEMCKQDDVLSKSNDKDLNGETSGETTNIISPQNEHQFLIEVTPSANEDEYLKTAISFAENHHSNADMADSTKSTREQGKKCMFCSEHFLDQDSMAMHVMSVHTIKSKKNMLSKGSNKDISDGIKREMSEQKNVVPAREYFRCDFCGNILDSRDSLAMHVLTLHADDSKKTNQSQNGKEAKDFKNYITIKNNEISPQRSQEEPLNLVSVKKQNGSPDHVQDKQNNICEQNKYRYSKQISSFSESKYNLTENGEIVHRPTRSTSLPDIRKPKVLSVARNRPISAGGKQTQERCRDTPNIITVDEREHSPICYNYEQPEPYIEDREHSCQYVTSPQNDPLELLLQKRENAHVCNYCEIIFLNRTLYYLHMGLHNVNNPLQCNMCGKTCDNIHDFSAHVIHL